MIRFYSGARDAQQKQAMAFELSDFDLRSVKFGELFRKRFMDIGVSMPLEEALDLAWQTLAECFEPHELLMKQELIDKYLSKGFSPSGSGEASGAEDHGAADAQ
jgi:V/A-type H+-transporting ATPase subunit B